MWDDIKHYRFTWLDVMADRGVKLPKEADLMRGSLLCAYASAATKQGNIELAQSCLTEAARFTRIPRVNAQHTRAHAELEIVKWTG